MYEAAALAQGRPPIDVEEALCFYDGDRELYRELLEIFARRHAHDMESLRTALSQGDRPSAHLLAHTLKGVAGTLVMPQLRSVMIEMDAHLREGGDGVVDDAIWRQFEIAFEAVRAALNSALVELA